MKDKGLEFNNKEKDEESLTEKMGRVRKRE